VIARLGIWLGNSDGIGMHCIHRINTYIFHDTQKIQREKLTRNERKRGKRKEKEGDTPALYNYCIAFVLCCVALHCAACFYLNK
jgi:hypothetical protein